MIYLKNKGDYEDNFAEMFRKLEPVSAAEIAASGVISQSLVLLWPFTIAYLRKRISKDQLKQAFVKRLGKSGIALASRMTWAIVLGPVFAWYLLARSLILMSRGVEQLDDKIRRVESRRPSAGD